MKHRAKSLRRGERIIYASDKKNIGRAAALETIMVGTVAVQTFTTMICGIETDTTGNYTWGTDFDCPDCLELYGLVILSELP